MRILIVEDDREMVETLAEIFTFEGFEPETALDGQQALNRLAQDPLPALVILDMHLPHVSGVEVLAHIREDERLAGLSVLVVTADANLAKTIQHHANAVLIKPVSIADMISLSEELIAAS